MFEAHNKLTKFTYFVVGVNSIVGLLFIWTFIPLFVSAQPALMWVTLGTTLLVLFLNSFLAYRIYCKSSIALKVCAWLYAIQIFGFETGSWAFNFTFGMQLFVSWRFESLTISINFAAVMIMILAYKAFLSVKTPVKGDVEQETAG